ncbi:hypothetical protein [Faecalimicrobium sp. JNUCC 81]
MFKCYLIRKIIIFIEYIDNREVDKGSYEDLSDNKYRVNGDIQSFEIILEEDNSFDIAI